VSFARSSIQTFIVRVGLTFIGLTVGIINSRTLGPAGLGTLTLLLLVREVCFRFGNLGLGSAFAYFVAKKLESTQRIIRIQWAAGALVSALTILMILAIWRKPFTPWNEIEPKLFYLALLTVPLFLINNFLQRILSGELRITAMNVSDAITTLGTVLFLFVFVVWMNWGIAGSLLAVIAADVCALSYLCHQCIMLPVREAEVPRERLALSGLLWRMWQYGFWSYLLILVNFFVEELPLLLLKTFKISNADIGLFRNARALGQQSKIVAVPVSQVLFPYTAAAEQKDATRRTNLLCRNSIWLMAVTTVVTLPIIKPLIVLLYGQEFVDSARIYCAMIIGTIVWPAGNFLAIHVAAAGKPRVVFLASVLIVASAFAACWYLIPRYGVMGAGIAFSIINVIQTGVRMVVYCRETGSSYRDVLLLGESDFQAYAKLWRAVIGRRGPRPDKSRGFPVRGMKDEDLPA